MVRPTTTPGPSAAVAGVEIFNTCGLVEASATPCSIVLEMILHLSVRLSRGVYFRMLNLGKPNGINS